MGLSALFFIIAAILAAIASVHPSARAVALLPLAVAFLALGHVV